MAGDSSVGRYAYNFLNLAETSVQTSYYEQHVFNLETLGGDVSILETSIQTQCPFIPDLIELEMNTFSADATTNYLGATAASHPIQLYVKNMGPNFRNDFPVATANVYSHTSPMKIYNTSRESFNHRTIILRWVNLVGGFLKKGFITVSFSYIRFNTRT